MRKTITPQLIYVYRFIVCTGISAYFERSYPFFFIFKLMTDFLLFLPFLWSATLQQNAFGCTCFPEASLRLACLTFSSGLYVGLIHSQQ